MKLNMEICLLSLSFVSLIMIVVIVVWANKHGYLKLKWYALLLSVVFFILGAISIAYSSDMNKMRYGIPVKFSTWGHNPLIESRDRAFWLEMTSSSKDYTTVKVTSEEFKENYGYDIYYHQLDSVKTPIDTDFAKSLEVSKVTLEMFLEGLEYYIENEIGDCEIYKAENLTKYLMHPYTHEPYSIIIQDNKIYIGPLTMQFEDVIDIN